MPFGYLFFLCGLLPYEKKATCTLCIISYSPKTQMKLAESQTPCPNSLNFIPKWQSWSAIIPDQDCFKTMISVTGEIY